MKKLLAVLLSVIISLSLFACAAKEAGGDTVPTQEEVDETGQTIDTTNAAATTEAVDEPTKQTENAETVPGETESTVNTSGENLNTTQTDPTQATSATNNSGTTTTSQGATGTSKNNGNTSSAPTQSSSNQATTPTGSGNNNTATTPTSPSTAATEPTPTTKPTEPTPTTKPTEPTPTTTPTTPPATTPTTPTTKPTEPAPTAAPTEPAPTETTPKETEPKEHTHTFVATVLSTAAKEDMANGGIQYAKYIDYTDWLVDRCSECGYIDMNTVRFRYTDYEAAVIMLGYVNDLRAEVYGTHEYDLVLDDTLLSLAKVRANELITNYSHDGTFTNAGENICNGYKSVYEQFVAWKNSPGHYANMITKEYKYFAYATTSESSTSIYLYGVQLFWTENARIAYFI